MASVQGHSALDLVTVLQKWVLERSDHQGHTPATSPGRLQSPTLLLDCFGAGATRLAEEPAAEETTSMGTWIADRLTIF